MRRSSLANPLERALADEADPLLGHEAGPELAEPLDLDRPAPRARYVVARAGSASSRRSRLLHRSHGSSPSLRQAQARSLGLRAQPVQKALAQCRRSAAHDPALRRAARAPAPAAGRTSRASRAAAPPARPRGPRPPPAKTELAQTPVDVARVEPFVAEDAIGSLSQLAERRVGARLEQRRHREIHQRQCRDRPVPGLVRLQEGTRPRTCGHVRPLAREPRAAARREVLEQRVQPTRVACLLLRDRRARDRALERRRADSPAREPVREEVLVVGDRDDQVRERRCLRGAISRARAVRSLSASSPSRMIQWTALRGNVTSSTHWPRRSSSTSSPLARLPELASAARRTPCVPKTSRSAPITRASPPS